MRANGAQKRSRPAADELQEKRQQKKRRKIQNVEMNGGKQKGTDAGRGERGGKTPEMIENRMTEHQFLSGRSQQNPCCGNHKN